MNFESVRQFCLALPHVTEEVLWENDLVFKIGGKMFAVLSLSQKPDKPLVLSFKCTPEEFAELVERDSIVPAPYAARYHWVALERFEAIGHRDLQRLLQRAYELVHDKLPKKVRAQLAGNS
jgi:predicted DNA-binding protein (MmcQ/YjbR family)